MERLIAGEKSDAGELLAAVKATRRPLRICGRFASSTNEVVTACGRAAETGLKAVGGIARALDAPTEDLRRAGIMEAEFYLDEYSTAVGDCGL